jgi:uncharacterized protein (DUF58 family)
MSVPGRGAIEGDTRFLDPEVAAALGNLELVARFIVEGFLIGLHKSPYHGFSAEFATYREYSPGDDLRYLDWKVLGRTDRFYLKQFEENTNLVCHLVLDCSGSMSVGGTPGGEVKRGRVSAGRVSKFTYARQLTAALAYLMLKQQDSVGLVAFADGPVKQVPARARSIQLARLLGELGKLEPERGTEVARGLAGIPEKLRRSGLVIFVSDCLADPDEIVETLKLFRTRGHEVLVFQVLSPEERDFPFRDLTEFVDAETGGRVLAQASDIKAAYMEALAGHVDLLKRRSGEMDVDFTELGTDQRLDRALVDYLAKRRRVG